MSVHNALNRLFPNRTSICCVVTLLCNGQWSLVIQKTNYAIKFLILFLGIESMGYGKGEKILRCKLAAVFRLIDLYGWTQGANTLITARLNQEDEQFLVNPYGMLFHEITASSLLKVGMQVR